MTSGLLEHGKLELRFREVREAGILSNPPPGCGTQDGN